MIKRDSLACGTVGLIVLLCATAKGADPVKTETPTLDSIKAEYLSRTAQFAHAPKSQGKDIYQQKSLILEDLLEKKVRDNAAATQELINEIAQYDDREFSDIAVDESVILLARHKNRDSLIKLLALKCPERIGLYMGIEVRHFARERQHQRRHAFTVRGMGIV